MDVVSNTIEEVRNRSGAIGMILAQGLQSLMVMYMAIVGALHRRVPDSIFLEFDVDVKARIGKVRGTFIQLKNMWSSKVLSMHIKIHLFNSNMKSTRILDIKMTIYYSIIARGTTPLCSYQEGAGNFEQIVSSMLPNIPTRNDARTTYTTNNDFMFHVMIENGIIYLCATDPECSKLTAYGFLNEIKSSFLAGSLAQRAHFAGDNELQRDFSPVLQRKMETYSNSTVGIIDGGGPLSKLQAQVNEVKDVMTQNIEKVLERGERLEDLVDKTEDLEASDTCARADETRRDRQTERHSDRDRQLIWHLSLVFLQSSAVYRRQHLGEELGSFNSAVLLGGPSTAIERRQSVSLHQLKWSPTQPDVILPLANLIR
ncbi:hypothetical protein LSH36_120g14010 [Paralvinella palmiformis]|uniref:Vesicle-associated membrane protein 7 n=1 Tax=Paralvinella palmiformis TaxID=53620 RepID=A0AAD9JZR0_9ANNE|nr:hypothetical protein LSH36_120g14010 [Paralvinella palmiformis]